MSSTKEALIGNDLFSVIAIMRYRFTIYNVTFKTKLHVIVLFVNFRLSDWFVFAKLHDKMSALVTAIKVLSKLRCIIIYTNKFLQRINY